MLVLLHLDYFVLYLSYVLVIIPLYFHYIRILINLFANVTYMFTAIYCCILYYMLLVCTPYLKAFNSHLMYMICYIIVAILIDLHPKKWINTYLFELVVTCIETHILVPNFSIFHRFISIIIFFCSFLLLGHIFALNFQHSKTCIQHHLYTIFEKIPRFSCFIFSHTRLQ